MQNTGTSLEMHGFIIIKLLALLLLMVTSSNARSLSALEKSKDNLMPQYLFKLLLPDGSSREETVETKFPGTSEEELILKGILKINFNDPSAQSITVYEADKNGYKVKYSYYKIQGVGYVGILALKSAAG